MYPSNSLHGCRKHSGQSGHGLTNIFGKMGRDHKMSGRVHVKWPRAIYLTQLLNVDCTIDIIDT